MHLTRTTGSALLLVLGLVLVLVLVPGDGAPAPASGPAADAATARPSAGAASRGRTARTARHVLAISVDGLRVRTVRDLGADDLPTIFRLRQRGAGTFDARTDHDFTITLPNHTGMVTGRRAVPTRQGGHGVTWNDERLRPRTVAAAAGHRVASVFSTVHAAGRRTALFASKQAFTLFERSWPQAIGRTVVREDNARLVGLARRDLAREGRALTFVHLSLPDITGHERGFTSRAYRRAVVRTDGLVGRLLSTVRSDRTLRGRTAVVLTSDHGAQADQHFEPDAPASYRVPFLVWGVGVARGADLYDLNPDYADPGQRRTRYSDRRQPVRNGMVANVATDLLGLPAVRGSEHDAGHDLDLR